MLNKNSLVNRTICLVLIFIIVTMIFSGCASKHVAEAEGEYVVFTDALGRKVKVKKNPQRVAALIGGFAEVWILSGGNICAAPADAWEDFDLNLGNAVNIGGAHSPNSELILSSNPEFVIASASTASNVELRDFFEKVNIPVAYFDVDSFDDYLTMLEICTDITGNKELYEKNGLKIKNEIETIKNHFFQEGLSENERSILLLRVSSGTVKSKGSSGTVLGEMLSEYGCVNIADSDKSLLQNLNVESILQRNPYRIFVVMMGDIDNADVNLKKMINENPAWQQLSAVRENRLHIMDRKLFHIKPNVRWPEAYEELSDILLEKQ